MCCQNTSQQSITEVHQLGQRKFRILQLRDPNFPDYYFEKMSLTAYEYNKSQKHIKFLAQKQAQEQAQQITSLMDSSSSSSSSPSSSSSIIQQFKNSIIQQQQIQIPFVSKINISSLQNFAKQKNIQFTHLSPSGSLLRLKTIYTVIQIDFLREIVNTSKIITNEQNEVTINDDILDFVNNFQFIRGNEKIQFNKTEKQREFNYLMQFEILQEQKCEQQEQKDLYQQLDNNILSYKKQNDNQFYYSHSSHSTKDINVINTFNTRMKFRQINDIKIQQQEEKFKQQLKTSEQNKNSIKNIQNNKLIKNNENQRSTNYDDESQKVEPNLDNYENDNNLINNNSISKLIDDFVDSMDEEEVNYYLYDLQQQQSISFSKKKRRREELNKEEEDFYHNEDSNLVE